MNFVEVGFETSHSIKAFQLSGALPLVASQVYSIESVGTLLTIRQAMANPSKITLVVKMVFILSLSLFLLNGWSFQLSYANPVQMAFYYFSRTNVLVHVLKVCFYLTLPATISITMFALFAIFESFSPFANLLGVEDSNTQSNKNLRNSIDTGDSTYLKMVNSGTTESIQNVNSQPSFWKIAGVRLLFGCILFFPILLNINEYFLILLTGSLISPCLGFVFPILAYNYYFREKLKKNKIKKIFNYGILIFGLSLNLASFIYTIKDNND